MKRKLTVAFLASWVALTLTPAVSADEVSVAYGATLRDKTGRLLEGDSRKLTIALYPSAGDETPLWARHYTVTLGTNGAFRVLLRDSERKASVKTVADASLAQVLRETAASTLVVGIRPDDAEKEIRPRQRLLHVPFALAARDAVGSRSESFSIARDATASGFVSRQSSKAVEFVSGLTVARELTFTSGGSVESTAFNVRSLEAKGDGLIGNPVRVGGAVTLKGGAFTVTRDLEVGAKATVGSLAVSKRSGVTAEPTVRVAGANGIVPLGTIVMWYGSADDLPEDWALCDGSKYVAPDGTEIASPNLVGRFPTGAGNRNGGTEKIAGDGGTAYLCRDTGGADTVTLKASEIPSHKHTFSFGWRGIAGVRYGYRESLALQHDCSHKENGGLLSWSTESTGGGQAHNNVPQYQTLVYIIKVK